jgi:hypothetical protein
MWWDPYSWVEDRAEWDRAVAEVRELLGEQQVFDSYSDAVTFTIGHSRYGIPPLRFYKKPDRTLVYR